MHCIMKIFILKAILVLGSLTYYMNEHYFVTFCYCKSSSRSNNKWILYRKSVKRNLKMMLILSTMFNKRIIKRRKPNESQQTPLKTVSSNKSTIRNVKLENLSILLCPPVERLISSSCDRVTKLFSLPLFWKHYLFLPHNK